MYFHTSNEYFHRNKMFDKFSRRKLYGRLTFLLKKLIIDEFSTEKLNVDDFYQRKVRN